jgi:hypothetical protein
MARSPSYMLMLIYPLSTLHCSRRFTHISSAVPRWARHDERRSLWCRRPIAISRVALGSKGRASRRQSLSRWTDGDPMLRRQRQDEPRCLHLRVLILPSAGRHGSVCFVAASSGRACSVARSLSGNRGRCRRRRDGDDATHRVVFQCRERHGRLVTHQCVRGTAARH